MQDRHWEQNSHSLQKYSEAKFKVINSSLGLKEAIALLKQEQVSCLLIESQLKLTGILTEGNIVELVFSTKDLLILNLEQVMTKNPIVLDVESNLSLAQIASLFQRYHVCHIPLVNDAGKGVGVITPGSILDNLDFQKIANYTELSEYEENQKNRKLAAKKIVEHSQNKQPEYLQLKSQNHKLEVANKQLTNKHYLNPVYLDDHFQTREEREKLLPEWKFLKIVLGQIPGEVIVAEAFSGKYLFVNDNLAEIFRCEKSQFNNLKDHIHFGFLEEDDSLSPLENCPLVKALKNNPVQGEEMRSLGKDKAIRTFFVNSIPIYNFQGSIVAEIATFYDTSNTNQNQLAIQEAENNSVCLKTIHHQIKNNLQVVSALLDLQSEQLKDKTAYLLLEKSQARIQTMALIYEQLYNSKNIEKIDFADYIFSLTRYLYDSFIEDCKHIELILNIEPIELDISLATPCGLIINELVTNSLLHGFRYQDKGKIQIDFFLDKSNQYNVHIIDNGSGINPTVSIKNNFEFLGISIVESLITEQLKGTWEISSRNGCIIKITFPKIKESVKSQLF